MAILQSYGQKHNGNVEVTVMTVVKNYQSNHSQYGEIRRVLTNQNISMVTFVACFEGGKNGHKSGKHLLFELQGGT